ncbi:MAG: hypothetical protein K6A65_06605 [Succinivibrionaceae bacterium]|nr:hypothetical protein [Succinivibrionaceae bacterium]
MHKQALSAALLAALTLLPAPGSANWFTDRFSNSARGVQEVIDPKALQESINQGIRQMNQWETENRNKLAEIAELEKTRVLEERNSEMPGKAGWAGIDEVNGRTLAMLHASKSLWQQYGSASEYLAAFKKSSAWRQCFSTRGCTFSRSLSLLDERGVDYATQAYLSAQRMQQKLSADIAALERISREARAAEGRGAALDALNKINSSMADSMLDLGHGTAALVGIISHDSAMRHQAAADNDSAAAYIFGQDLEVHSRGATFEVGR